ncbi:MAG: hypothetical protein IKT61_05470 [Clostridia bacterium]|nr:hypothetical protein [Clostridia bacterium]
MDIKALLNKNKYGLTVFSVSAMLCLIYDGFESALTLLCKLLLCVTVAVFLSPRLKQEKQMQSVTLPAFAFLSIIGCNVIFLTSDLHILLSLSAFFLSLFFSKKCKVLTPVFTGLCVLAMPLTLLILVPTVVVVQFIRNQKMFAVLSTITGVLAFVVTKLLETNVDFYAHQGGAYYLWLHPVHFSKTHTEYLLQFLFCSISLVLMALVYVVKLITKKRVAAGISLLLTSVLAVYGFSLCKSTHTVFMILIPVFAGLVALSREDGFKEAIDEIGDFFATHTFVFLLLLAFIAGAPMILGSLPFESEFFTRSTFIIFREE